ncbi:NADPH-dependent assimilatory sulfite reductase hemoprotein subunit [Dichotomicrobium thermohalophilum]|uniref:Sulfite reductase [NADPH] hemoprotein beta-component n=1 Tax=Dichotomicrobium thermohalophilum TaxID=933063 RepID=A0A397Q4F7_9HYPH|nr:NADPH-dependent assimilatory sulfite reductase hemoprotein subunit [Dichotomicrobium thermohalophilum]RIA55823.1 sulfite reductase (NADPH) beta subunit [Dichotomicrobium thermohalophilum]
MSKAAERHNIDRSVDRSQPVEKLHPNERIKLESGYLRGALDASLAERITGAVLEDDHQLTKFHGTYQQDDRDLREERRRSKLEPAYSFMIRVRLPGGVCQPEQWLQLDELARNYANNTLRLTTRQTFQFHGVLKRDLATTMQGIHDSLLDTIAACGDVNRGVMATPIPEFSALHAQVFPIAKAVSEHLLPGTRAYHEIWLNEQPVYQGDKEDEVEPVYGKTYLPRKFKIGFAIPPVNDVDVFTQDIGFIAIADEDDLAGFNVAVGGGMGRTDNEPSTYPRLGDVIGFIPPDKAVEVAEKIVTIQRDFGNRVDRKLARMKYTIDRNGLDWFVDELEERLGWKLEPARDYHFDTSTDRFGWSKNAEGTWNYTAFIENGRVKDDGAHQVMTGLREIAKVHKGDLRITPNQNLIIACIPARQKARIRKLLEKHGIIAASERSTLRRHSMACVAFPTCGLAMAESERYLPSLITKVEGLLEETGLGDVGIVIRMSGCNNGCSRPYVAEIGFSGRAPGKYNMYLGGGYYGQRLAKPYLENIGEETILQTLRPMFAAYAEKRRDGEAFGDFVIRRGYVAAVHHGTDFNAEVEPEAAGAGATGTRS